MASDQDLFTTVEKHMLSNNYKDLESIFFKLKQRFDLANQLCEYEIYSNIGKTVGREVSVESYFPSSVLNQKLIALSSSTSGDCLYSSASLAIFSNNSFCDDLRILTSIELFIHSSFYAQHPMLCSFWENNKSIFSSFMSVFSCCVSDSAFNSKTSSVIEIVKNEAAHTCHKNAWSSFLCILGLSTVLDRRIETYYPDTNVNKYSLLFNTTKISPRMIMTESALTPIRILFCRSTPTLENCSIFQPNHFVPLITSNFKGKKNKSLSFLSLKRLTSEKNYSVSVTSITKSDTATKPITILNFFKKGKSSNKNSTI